MLFRWNYLVSHGSARSISKGTDRYSLVTCEAKQLGERILEDQIREQVAEAFKQTSKLVRPHINAVKPFAIQVRSLTGPTGATQGLYVVEFQAITRRVFERYHAPNASDPERLYRMRLEPASEAVYTLSPSVRGVNV